MSEFENDLTLAKRLSLVTDDNRCHATSFDPPHAPLETLLARLHQAGARCEELAEKNKPLDAGYMAERICRWAEEVQSTLVACNAAERQRSDDVFKAIDWYNANLEASRKSTIARYEQGKREGKEEAQLKSLQMSKTKMEVQEPSHEAGIAQLEHSPTPNDKLQDPAQPTVPTPSSYLPVAPHESTSPPPTNTSIYHIAQPTSWTSKYDRLADQDAELRKAKTGEPAIKGLIAAEVERIKAHYDLQIQHHKDRAEMLAAANVELTKQLQERGSLSEKRKATEDLELQHDGNGEESRRRRRGVGRDD
ncbi:hypothetical protein CC86DRAFT_387502 [Ophiobolus disseminans]|uniref:Uncharacterized protein n=1 Tax=Ophiobolus disseminans TaxID=1469910 RepID=A0A6A6ZFI3_9PLEO|nr:hypothetical protein CC86DRAFT_387502 [Ophiobolus disseminans]